MIFENTRIVFSLSDICILKQTKFVNCYTYFGNSNVNFIISSGLIENSKMDGIRGVNFEMRDTLIENSYLTTLSATN